MARLAGVDLPRNKRMEIALTYIYGIGPSTATALLTETGISPDLRTDDLNDEQLSQLRDAIVPLVDPRPLCAPECAGLCDVCGEKWADLPEDHDHFVVDPRLASLASLLGEDSESGRS